jgi:hypothetical protein
MYQTINEYSHKTFGITINAFVQISIVLVVVALVAWAMFFTNYPAAHDLFHELRHSLYVIPCH